MGCKYSVAREEKYGNVTDKFKNVRTINTK